MKTLAKTNIVAVSLAIMCLGGLHAAQPKTDTVTVINTTANPVPVTVQNPETGTLSVKNADNPAFQPYQVQESVGVTSPNGYYKTASFDVPAGKRLVIELVTIKAAVDPGERITEARVEVTKAGGGVLSHHLTPTALGVSPGGGETFAVTQPLRLYCEAGTGALKIQTERTSTSGAYLTLFSVSGYLIDLP